MASKNANDIIEDGFIKVKNISPNVHSNFGGTGVSISDILLIRNRVRYKELIMDR